mgnify:CR=1 FL=1
MRIETIDYDLDGQPFQGRLVHDGSQPAPGLIMAPNWLGVTPDAERRAGLFARRGFTVFIPDVYGARHRPADMIQAAPLADALRADPALARRRMLAALATLEVEGDRRGLLVPTLRAAVGFCFGGGNVLELARAGAPIQAAVAIHGDLTTRAPASPGDLKAAILALHGAEDPVAPKADRDSFEAEMAACEAAWRLMIFGRALHAFTDPGVDHPPIARYDAQACKTTYDLTCGFIADAFAGDFQEQCR